MSGFTGEERRQGSRAQGTPARRRGDTLEKMRLLREAAADTNYQATLDEWWAWLTALPEERQLAYFLQVFDFERLIGLPVEKIGAIEGPIERKRHEALMMFALAIWRLHEVQSQKKGK